MGGPISKEGQGKQPARPRVRPDNVLVPLPSNRTPPAPPEHLSEVGATAWRSAYSSAPWLGSAADEQIVSIWSRLAEERDELLALIAEGGRTTSGSMGQLTSHPLIDQLRAVESEQLKFAAVLGLGSQNAARLGISVSQLARQQDTSLEEMIERRRRKPGVS
jgi:phage terminase small subunit